MALVSLFGFFFKFAILAPLIVIYSAFWYPHHATGINSVSIDLLQSETFDFITCSSDGRASH